MSSVPTWHLEGRTAALLPALQQRSSERSSQLPKDALKGRFAICKGSLDRSDPEEVPGSCPFSRDHLSPQAIYLRGTAGLWLCSGTCCPAAQGQILQAIRSVLEWQTTKIISASLLSHQINQALTYTVYLLSHYPSSSSSPTSSSASSQSSFSPLSRSDSFLQALHRVPALQQATRAPSALTPL